VTTFLQATVAGLSLASIYMLLALGFVIIYKSMQVLSFAHPAIMLFSARWEWLPPACWAGSRSGSRSVR
jgi:branched-subunit amino acid ABC-type transport system permease component